MAHRAWCAKEAAAKAAGTGLRRTAAGVGRDRRTGRRHSGWSAPDGRAHRVAPRHPSTTCPAAPCRRRTGPRPTDRTAPTPSPHGGQPWQLTRHRRDRTILAEITDMLVRSSATNVARRGEITCDTTFNDDLALESIEFVALAELLQQRYGTAVDFLALLAEKDIEEILAMTVGELVAHIDRVTAADAGLRGLSAPWPSPPRTALRFHVQRLPGHGGGPGPTAHRRLPPRPGDGQPVQLLLHPRRPAPRRARRAPLRPARARPHRTPAHRLRQGHLVGRSRRPARLPGPRRPPGPSGRQQLRRRAGAAHRPRPAPISSPPGPDRAPI